MKNIVFAVMLLSVACQNSNASDLFVVDHVVTSSPGVHDLTDKISVKQVVEKKFDITKFGVKIALDSDTFNWCGQLGDEPEVVGKILKERFNVADSLNVMFKRFDPQQMKDFMSNLMSVVRLFQEIEAEGVFYRDLKAKLDKNHNSYVNDKDYQATRTTNLRIVNDFFDLSEALGKGHGSRLMCWSKSPKMKNKSAASLLTAYKNVINSGEISLQVYKERLLGLRQKYGLPSAEVVPAVLNTNN